MEISDRDFKQLVDAFGDVIVDALNDDDVTDILVNEDGKIWVESLSSKMSCYGELSSHKAIALINILASLHDSPVTRDSPILSCELPDNFGGARFEGNIPPIVENATIAIRKKVSRRILLEDYLADDLITNEQLLLLESLVARKANLVVCGSTGSGKTTLSNAILSSCVDVFPDDRFYLIEDTIELQCTARNLTQKRVVGNCDMNALLRSALRQRPDRIIIGEVRGSEAWTLLKCWNTGHPGGLCTIHAEVSVENSYLMALKRLELLSLEHPDVLELEYLREFVGEVVDGVVCITRVGSGKRIVSDVIEIKFYDGKNYVIGKSSKNDYGKAEKSFRSMLKWW